MDVKGGRRKDFHRWDGREGGEENGQNDKKIVPEY